MCLCVTDGFNTFGDLGELSAVFSFPLHPTLSVFLPEKCSVVKFILK